MARTRPSKRVSQRSRELRFRYPSLGTHPAGVTASDDGHQLLQIAICEAILQVPPDAQDDDLILEMKPSETRSRVCHQAHGIRDGPAAFATDLCGGPLVHARWPTPPGVESVPV
jgi:hypothetical protein